MTGHLRSTNVAAIACAVAATSAGCGSSSSEESTSRPTPSATASATVAAVKAPPTPGCHQFCAQAGGYGGGANGKPASAFLKIRTHGSVSLVGDVLPVKLTCVQHARCRGAILLDPQEDQIDFEAFLDARSDLDVKAGHTATIGVPISRKGIALIRRRHGRGVHMAVLADYGDPRCPAGSELPCVAFRRVVVEGGTSAH